MDEKEIDEILNSYKWIKVKKFNPLELGDHPDEKYEGLMEHHIEETSFLINKVRELTLIIRNLQK
jgi:hypothetical protein